MIFHNIKLNKNKHNDTKHINLLKKYIRLHIIIMFTDVS